MSAILLGLSDEHLVAVPQINCQLHKAVVAPILQLNECAAHAGFCVKVASSFRSFDRQLAIWNAKATGLRPVLNAHGQAIDLTRLSDVEKVHAILRWSALPGASRHHWGTDLDIYDGAAVGDDYRVQLVQEECCDNGPFTAFHQWLTSVINTQNSVGFYRPYSVDRGGVAPEPWHISYAPLADQFAQQRTEAVLRTQLERSDIALKSTVLEHFSALYQRYVLLSIDAQGVSA